jgi:HD-GYP domain-containing protein (c-di-GMP phosphodiesterase class II)
MRGEVGINVEFTLRRKDTNETWVGAYNYAPIRNGSGVIVGTVVTARDVTLRKQAEVELRHTASALATLSAVNRSLVHAVDEDALLHAICQDIVEQSGYKMAWVGYAQHDEAKSIKIMAGSKGSEGYLATKHITWDETEFGMGPTGRAVRSGATEMCLDIAHDAQYLPWRSEAIKYGYASSISLPLFELNHEGHPKVLGNLNVYAGVANAFFAKEVELLEQMAGDVAFGINALRTRHERNLAVEEAKLQLKKLQGSLDDTVRAIASIGELRDPYTAGHQLRVAKLATAIAMAMQLPAEQIHALHIAATVHDLGKIMIPAEILSKPGRITDIEYSLIKGHPQAGYDILKGIDFPWPIAQIVLQHHERLDGSGYPQGLKGDAILLEARILAVADVVEAMSSHRPYRAGLGIDVALDEITSKRESYYDTQVVDACVSLFRDKGFSI